MLWTFCVSRVMCPHFHRIGPLGRFDHRVAMSVCVCVCVFVCPFCPYMHLCICLPPLPEVGCPKFLEIRNPWGKVMERSGLRYEHFCLKIVENRVTKKSFFFADFAGLFQWGGYITTWGGYIEIWSGYITTWGGYIEIWGGYIGMMRLYWDWFWMIFPVYWFC